MYDNIDMQNNYDKGWMHGFIIGAILDIVLVGILLYAVFTH